MTKSKKTAVWYFIVTTGRNVFNVLRKVFFHLPPFSALLVDTLGVPLLGMSFRMDLNMKGKWGQK